MENNDQLHIEKWIDDRLASLDPAPGGDNWTPDVNRGLSHLRGRGQVRKTRARLWTWCAAAAAASLCLMAFPAPRSAAQYCLNCSLALWQNLSASKVIRPRLGPISARKPAPNFILHDASGAPRQLSSFHGRVVLLNFWATWCGGCKIEIPWFIDFQQTYGARGFQALGVSFDDDGWKLVKPFIAAHRVNYPVLLGDPHLAVLYGGVEALPVTFLIDKAGRIAATHLGLVSRSDYQAEIEELLRE